MLRRLSFSVVTALLVLVGAELTLRGVYAQNELLFSWERPDGWMYFEETGILAMRPGTEDIGRDGEYVYTFRTNEQGLREDDSVEVPKPSGQYRVLALGDSWMFGLNATQGQTMPDVLERTLPSALGVESVEVVNAGVVGGCAFDMLRLWRRLGASLDVDAVLLSVPHNEGRQVDVDAQRSDWYARAPTRARNHLRLYLAIRRATAFVSRPTYPELPKLDASVKDLVVLISEARTAGLPVWTIAWPARLEESEDTAWLQHVDWIEPLVDADASVVGHLLQERGCWGEEDTSHASESGYAASAQLLTSVIAGDTVGDGSWYVAPRCR